MISIAGAEAEKSNLRRCYSSVTREAPIRQLRIAADAPATRLFDACSDGFEAQRARTSPKSRRGEAVRHIFRLWHGLTRFLWDGRAEMDASSVELATWPPP